MNRESDNTEKRDALILGCGYLGRVVAKKLVGHPSYDNIYGLVRKQSSGKELSQQNVRAIIGDILQPMTLYSINRLWGADSNDPRKLVDVFYMIPPGRDHAEAMLHDGIKNTCQILRSLANNIHRAILVSSTAVYGQTGGVQIDADTEAKPNNQRAKWLIDGENQWLSNGKHLASCVWQGFTGQGGSWAWARSERAAHLSVTAMRIST